MSVQYKPVLWDRTKIWYDVALLAMVVVYIAIFLEVAPRYAEFTKPVDVAIQRMRAFGSCAFLMLTAILCIGPLARLDRRFMPLLYNRRHFGVMTAAVASAHVVFVLDWYFAFSPTPPFEAMLSANTSFGRLPGFPFEIFGLLAFAILLVMAVTSHDFWLSFLTPPVWKAIHMSVYAAYALIVAHVAFGYLQDVRDEVFAAVVTVCALSVAALHVIAAAKERKRDGVHRGDREGWISVGAARDIDDGRARIVTLPGGERVAVFRIGARFSALSNVCAHQNGPLGEGRVIGGCVTCPWHGHQFRPEDGCAPAPFTDKVPTYRLRRDGDRLLVHQTALAPGAYVEPVEFEELRS